MRKRITDEKRIVIKFLLRNEIVIYISDKDVIIGKIAADNMISNKVVSNKVVTWYRLSLEQTFGFRRCFFCGSYAGKPESKPYLCKERQSFFPLPRM